MDEQIKLQALVRELEEQRAWALTRCAQMAGELSLMAAKIKELENKEVKTE